VTYRQQRLTTLSAATTVATPSREFSVRKRNVTNFR